jgi:hypothetical protein
MSSIRHFMTEDHRRCDDLFAEAEQAIAKNNLAAAQAAFEHFRGATLAHFDGEEKTGDGGAAGAAEGAADAAGTASWSSSRVSAAA